MSGQPTLVFSHANGFPAGTYNALFEVWRQAGWRVLAVEKFGHSPRWPVAEGWEGLRDQLLALIDEQAQGGPVALVGHSLGGYLSLLAACHRPEAAATLVLLDSPIVAGWRAQVGKAAKALGLFERLGPGAIAARRRQHWPSREQAGQHLGSKAAFARWAPQVMQNFLRHGLNDVVQKNGNDEQEAAVNGVSLAFDRDIERRLYNSLPLNLPAVLASSVLRCPVHFVGARDSEEMRMAGAGYSRQWVASTQGQWHTVPGGHLFPMERPKETAQLVLHCLQP